MNYDNYYKKGGMTKEESISAIALRIGARKDAVEKFVEEHKIDTNKLNSDLKSGDVYFMDVITAIVGKPNNKYQKEVIKKYGNKMAKGGEISVYNLRKGDKVKTRKGDIETIIRKTGSGSYETIENDYSHSPESLEFLSRPSRKMAMGGKTQGYDDREDERLGMKYGMMSGKDFDGSHDMREHSRRDDARFEERMARGGELTYDDFMVGDFYFNSSEGGKFKFVGKDESGRLRFQDSKGIDRIFSPKRMSKYADGGIMARGGYVSKGELVWKKLTKSERMKFLHENFTPQITPRTQETLVGKDYNFLPKNVKIVMESKYANVENYADGGMMADGGEVYYVRDFYPNYDEDKIASILKSMGAKKVRKAKLYGYSNQPDVVVFQGDKNKAQEILEKEFPDNYISIYEKDWGRKMADGGETERDKNGMLYALQEHVSSGEIASKTNASKYVDIDQIRSKAIQYYVENGDKPYSYAELESVLKKFDHTTMADGGETERKAEAIKTAVEIATMAYNNGVRASDMSFEDFTRRIFDLSNKSYPRVDLRLAYESMKKSNYAKGGKISRNKNKNDFKGMFDFFLENNDQPIGKRDLINMAYESSNGIDSAIPQSMVGDVDNTAFFVYDYQTDKMGELVDLRMKLKYSNVKVDVTIVQNGELKYGNDLPYELENATFHQALNYVFTHDDIEQFSIRPRKKFELGGMMADGGQIDEDTLWELSSLVMDSINPENKLSLDEFLYAHRNGEKPLMTDKQEKLVVFVLKMYDDVENITEKTLNELATLVMDSINSDVQLPLYKFMDEVPLTNEQEELCAFVLGMFDYVAQEYFLVKDSKTFEKGGAIENQYKNRSAQDIWESWNQHQKFHFLTDHKQHPYYNMGKEKFVVTNADKEKYMNMSYEELPKMVKLMISDHIEEGEYEKGGAIKGSNPSTGERFGVVLGSLQKEDGITFLTIRSMYSSRINSYELRFDEKGFLYSIGDFGYSIDGTFPDMNGRASVRNINADNKKESIDALAKITSPSFAKKVYDYVQEEKMAKGGETKNKWDYTDKDEIEYVVVKDKSGKELKFDGKNVLSGVHDLLEKGGKLTEIGKYYSKNDVVSVVVNGKNILDKNTVSGVWIKKDAKPMAEDVADMKIGKTTLKKGFNGWVAKTMVDNFKGFDWDITTIKNSRGDLTTTAQGGKSEDKGGYKMFTFMVFQDPAIRLKSSRPARVTDKVVSAQHEEAMKDFKERKEEIAEMVDEIQAKKKMADGGYVVSKADEDGYVYILDADGKKVSDSKIPSDIGYGKVKNKFVVKKAKYDTELGKNDANQIVERMNSKYAKGGAIGFDALAKKVAKNYEGDKVKKEFQDEYGKTYDKQEAEEVGKKVAGKVYRQQQAKGKMAKGGKTNNRSENKMTQISRKASEIRKADESWRDAFNRAKAMIG